MNAFRLGSFLNWSLSVGRLFGIPIRLHITILFFLLPAIQGLRQGIGFWYGFEFAVGIVISILIHELGHALTAKHFRMTGLSIMLHGFGGFAMSSGRRTPRQSLLISLAGPAATFATGGVCILGGRLGMAGTEEFSSIWIQFALLNALGRVNILLGLLNLIPVLPWDGGQALQAALAHRMPEIKAMRAVAHLGLILAPCLVIYGFATNDGFFGIFGFLGGLTSYSRLAESGGIRFGEFFADRRHRKEMEAVKRREVERADAFRDDVDSRERERAEKERLRRIFEASDLKD